MNRVFIGLDRRQPVSYTVAAMSMIDSRAPVLCGPIGNFNTPCTRKGLTEFTWSRFLVPWLCDYQGWALFVDGDTMMRGDVADLFALADEEYAVMVPRIDEPRYHFERAAVMLFNCGHPDNAMLTPEMVNTTGVALHKIGWPEAVGDLPADYNHLVGYYDQNPDARLVHFTQGVPCWPETADSEHAAEWVGYAKAAMSAAPWSAIMGASVHAAPVMERLAKRQAAE